MIADIEPYKRTWIWNTKKPYHTARFLAISNTSKLCLSNLLVSSFSFAKALTVRTFPKASSATLAIAALLSCYIFVNFFIAVPKKPPNITVGMIPSKVTPVSAGE